MHGESATAPSPDRPAMNGWLRAAVYLRVNRWTDWALLVVLYVSLGATLRAFAVPDVMAKWANAWHQRWYIAALGLTLGVLEDLCVCVCLCAALWAFDVCTTKPVAGHAINLQQREQDEGDRGSNAVQRAIAAVASDTNDLSRFAVYALAFLVATFSLGVDHVFVRARQVRFSTDFLVMLMRERDAASSFQVDDGEWAVIAWTLLPLLGSSLLVGYLGACWMNLAEWDVVRAVHRRCVGWRLVSSRGLSSYRRVHGDDKDSSVEEECEEDPASVPMASDSPQRQRAAGLLSPSQLLALLIATLFLATFAIARLVPSIVALIALNPTLNEPVRLLTGCEYFALHQVTIRKYMSEFVETETEQAEFFDPDSLYRRTKGFKGPKAFDIKIAPHERPNVLVLVIESFRQRDSRYLLQSQAEQLLPDSVTLTPHFDAWAKSGVAFSNMWSTWRTSRSIETILFGQVPYESITETGTTGGRIDTTLSGLPQLLKAKGYDTMFTTGTRADYDNWETFLPAHGFDEVLDMWKLAEISENEMGVDWTRGNYVMTYWGIHDDLSLGVLSHLLRRRQAEKEETVKDILAARKSQRNQTTGADVNQTAVEDEVDAESTDERDQVAINASTPWFATHYTISSHVPFEERPDWYFRYQNELPDFSAYYRGHQHEELLKNYAEMRYFSDLVFGRFMEELRVTGVLDDTIVVVVGDHGQAPEFGSATPERDQVSTTRVAGAIIAEGRLGKSAGTIIDDVASQSDLLNTIADIVGVPSEGFLQTGIGHSLKRAMPFGKRAVYCNNPAMNNAVIQGHIRMQYFAEASDAVQAYYTHQDPLQQHDLMGGGLPQSRVQQILDMCDEGRALSAYYKRRWDGDCLLEPTC